MSEFGKELIDSANEALAIAEGRLAPALVIAPEAIDVSAIRRRLHLSQDKFAARFGLSAATVARLGAEPPPPRPHRRNSAARD